MKNIITLGIHYAFFITTLLFLPNNTAMLMAIFLIACLALEKIYYTILPLILCLFLPFTNSFILLCIFICHILLNYFIKKNRFYAFTIYLLSLISTYIILFLYNSISLDTIQIILYLIIIYGIINILHTYQTVENKNHILPYNQKLIYLTLLLTYFFIFIKYKLDNIFFIFLFMQLFLIKDHKYNIIFTILYTLYLYLIIPNLLTNSIITLAASFFPPIVFLVLSYKNYLWIILGIYTLILTFFHIKDKKITYEQDYINTLFNDFSKYINQLSIEFNKNDTLHSIKQEKITEINQKYCNKCHKATLCKLKPDRRISFILGGINGINQNIFDCPYYEHFYVDNDLKLTSSQIEYSGIKSLSEELNILYNQSLLLKNDYEYFLGLLSSYNYKILKLNIHLSCPTIYFTITFSKQKPIIENLLLKLAYKSFGEKLELKTIIEENSYIVHFFKAPKLKLTYAHTILPKNNNLISGDNYYIKKDYNSSYIFALSDGMGSGYSAYLESSDALKTISTLTSYHFSIKTILKLLGDLYNIKNNYDHYATLDFLHINTANRKMNLYKMGSTTTYILHNHQLYTYENKALPLKVDDVNSAYEIDIYSGDYIFLLSDGISDFISKDEFYSIVGKGNENVDKLCDNIINHIKKKQKNELKDDLSLIAIKAI